MNSLARKILFVTGTDTGVGKTAVSCGVVGAMIRRGLRIEVSKPVETGCARDSAGNLIPQDGVKLQVAAGGITDLKSITPFRFELPAAPTVAAAAAGSQINFGSLVEDLMSRSARCDLLLVEGAGGLLVPITEDHNFADLIAALGAKTVVVAGSKLGAINHTALTCEVLRRRSLPLLGYVLNECFAPTDSDRPAVETNRAEIRRILAKQEVEELAYIEHFSDKSFFPADRLSCAAPVFTDLATILAQKLGL